MHICKIKLSKLYNFDGNVIHSQCRLLYKVTFFKSHRSPLCVR